MRRSRRRGDRRLRLLLVAVALVVAGCSGDDDGGDDPADEASFCRLAVEHAPLSEASAAVLRRLEELAPGELEEQVGVLLELAEELDDMDPTDPDSLALEFEVRFDDEHVAARAAVDRFVKAECASALPTTTTADDGATSDPSIEQDGVDNNET